MPCYTTKADEKISHSSPLKAGGNEENIWSNILLGFGSVCWDCVSPISPTFFSSFATHWKLMLVELGCVFILFEKLDHVGACFWIKSKTLCNKYDSRFTTRCCWVVSPPSWRFTPGETMFPTNRHMKMPFIIYRGSLFPHWGRWVEISLIINRCVPGPRLFMEHAAPWV